MAADNSIFKRELWDAIEDVFYEFNGMYGNHFGKKDVEEVLEDHADYFDENEIYYDPHKD